MCACDKAFGGSNWTAVPSGHNITTKTGIMEAFDASCIHVLRQNIDITMDEIIFGKLPEC